MVTIQEVRSTADLKRFVAFPEVLYRRHPYYVPKFVTDELNTLRSDRNPAFDYCQARYWMAYRNGPPVGRVAAIVNQRYIDTWKKRRARFGWIDFVDDPDVSAALLGAVEQWARDLGMEGVHGPLGFCDLDREGMLIEGFDELDLMITIYNHPYYPVHLERLGYGKDVDWVEYEFKVPAEVPDTIARIARVVLDRSKLRLVTVRRKKDIEPYIPGVFRLINDTYQHLYSVVLLSERQIDYYAKVFMTLLRPEYVKIILDAHGEVAAVRRRDPLAVEGAPVLPRAAAALRLHLRPASAAEERPARPAADGGPRRSPEQGDQRRPHQRDVEVGDPGRHQAGRDGPRARGQREGPIAVEALRAAPAPQTTVLLQGAVMMPQ